LSKMIESELCRECTYGRERDCFPTAAGTTTDLVAKNAKLR
jgi:hypothetical protein